MKIRILSLVLIGSVASQNAQATAFSAGSCSSQGSWTRSALDQARVIEGAAQMLKDDPNCKGIESVLSGFAEKAKSLEALRSEDVARTNAVESGPREMDSLRGYVATGTGSLAGKAIQALASKTMENTVMGLSSEALVKARQNTQRAASLGITMLDEVVGVLPRYSQCLNNHPDQQTAIMAAAVQMAGTFASSGEGVTARLGNSIGSLVTLMRDMKFASVMRKTNESQYWMSMACLIESTSTAYCQANEAYQLLDYQEKEMGMREKFAEEGFPSNTPLDGYYLLVRELPAISEWMQKVQFGIKPRDTSVSGYKNTTLDSMNDLQKSVNSIQGHYSEAKQQYDALPDIKSKQNYAITMVKDLSSKLISGGGGYGNDSPGKRNFFTTAVMPDMIIYSLLGLDKLPQEVAGKGDGMRPLSFDEWILLRGEVNPILANPDEVVKRMGQKLDDILASAQEKGSEYFRGRMVVDNQNLVSESVTSATISVEESFKNIRNYLEGLRQRMKNNEKGRTLIPSLVDTIRRIDHVLAGYKNVRAEVDSIMKIHELEQDSSLVCSKSEKEEVDKYLSEYLAVVTGAKPDSLPADLPTALKKQINEAYVEVVSRVFDEFNMASQRDGFLTTRLSTFIKFDYADRLKRKENMSEYQQLLLTIAGKNFLDHLTNVHQLNPAQAEVDLNAAQVVNVRNLEAVETLMGDSLTSAISDLNRTAGGLVVNTGTNPTEIVDGGILSTVGNAIGKTIDAVVPGGPLSSKNSYYALPSKDGNAKAFEQFRSQLCIQSLAFKDESKYNWLCTGSKLESRFREAAKQADMKVDYDKVVRAKRNDGNKMADRACAFRRYLQDNQAYWLTTQHQ